MICTFMKRQCSKRQFRINVLVKFSETVFEAVYLLWKKNNSFLVAINGRVNSEYGKKSKKNLQYTAGSHRRFI